MKTKLLIALTAGLISSAVMAGGDHSGGHMDMSGHEGMHMGGHHHSGDSAVGLPGKDLPITKTINVSTLDNMRFKFSDEPGLKAGDVVKFIVTNEGKVKHEFSIGDAKEQKSHAAMMSSMPNMKHEDGNTVTVNPGETREVIWQFTAAAEVIFACNVPGHFEAGMFKKETVIP